MPNVEERLASLEARMDTMSELRGLIIEMRGDMNRLVIEMRSDMNRQFSEVREDMDRQFSEVRGDMTRQFSEVRGDMNRQFSEMNLRVHALDEKEDRHFTWVIGIQVASILAVVGVLAGAYYR